MWNVKNYRFGFDPWGLGLFLLVMLPNLIWFAVPAPNDILRAESVTPLLDAVGQVFQLAMAAALCGVRNIAQDQPMKRGNLAGTAACAALYLAGWTAYYAGIANAAVVLDLCLAPCGRVSGIRAGAEKRDCPALSRRVHRLPFPVCRYQFHPVRQIKAPPPLCGGGAFITGWTLPGTRPPGRRRGWPRRTHRR